MEQGNAPNFRLEKDISLSRALLEQLAQADLLIIMSV